YAALAEAYGAAGFTVSSEEELEPALAEALSLGRTAVVDCRVDPREQCFPMIPAGAAALDLIEYSGDAAASAAGRGAEVRHTISALLENKPGALLRIVSMFARRGYNIDSLAVGTTERHDVSRVTLRVDCEQHPLEQIEKQMHKLVNVLRVAELVPGESIERELALIKVAAPPERRAELLALSDVFHARVADVGPEALVFEIAGTPEEIDSF